MGLYEELQAEREWRRRPVRLSWPIGAQGVSIGDQSSGHDQSTFTPDSYGEYIATSAEVYAAAHLRARQMSQLELLFFRGRRAEKVEVTRGPVPALFQNVNPFWTLNRLLRMDELSMCLFGQSVWAVNRPGGGDPEEIWWLKGSRVRPVPHPTKYVSRFLYEPVMGGQPISFSPEEIVWFRYPNPIDEFSPLSPLAAARLAADTASAMMQANRNIFTNGLQMSGIVVPAGDKVTFSADQAKELELDLTERFKGVDKAHKWAVLRYEASVKDVGITPKDAEFVNGLNLTMRQVCNAYAIPSPLLNDLEHATLANAREFKLLLWENGLVPDAELRAADIEEQLLPMFGRAPGRPTPDHCEWDYSRIPALQESMSDAWARDRQAIEVGALTINEVRKARGLPPVEWGDVFWAPVNKSAVSDGSSRPEGDTGRAVVPVEEEEPARAASRLTHWQAREFLAAAGFRNGH
jgi:HK97 family phage portal protein